MSCSGGASESLPNPDVPAAAPSCAEMVERWQGYLADPAMIACSSAADCTVVGGQPLQDPCNGHSTIGYCGSAANAAAYRASPASKLETDFAATCPNHIGYDCGPGYAACTDGMCTIAGFGCCFGCNRDAAIPEPPDGQLDGRVGADGSGLSEAAAPDRPEQRDAPAACTGALEDRWGICPATFDGHPETFGCRFGVSGFVRAAVIDGRQVIEWSNFPTTVQCVYASVNDGAALAGEINIADTLLFCDRTSYSQAFGSVPDCLPWSCALADLCTPSSCTCPLDAGAADASADAAE